MADVVVHGPDGWLCFDGRFRIASVKCGPGVVITAGPNAKRADEEKARAAVDVFDSIELAVLWLREH